MASGWLSYWTALISNISSLQCKVLLDRTDLEEKKFTETLLNKKLRFHFCERTSLKASKQQLSSSLQILFDSLTGIIFKTTVKWIAFYIWKQVRSKSFNYLSRNFWFMVYKRKKITKLSTKNILRQSQKKILISIVLRRY